jgi:hypothetical protein
MAEQTAVQRATEHFENAVTALRSATTHYQKASTGQPWPLVQAAMEEMLHAQERYDRAEEMLRKLAAEIGTAKSRRLA